MFFDARVFHTSKDQNFALEYEDAFHFDPETGRAAIADGVSSAIFSRQWAQILTRETVASIPDLHDTAAFQAWLAERRGSWLTTIDFPKLAWNQRLKLQQVGGAYATLLWLELFPEPAGEGENAAARYQLRSYAVGDCCLFHVRQGEILASFPMTSAADFERDPISLCSVNMNRDHQLEFQSFGAECAEHDLLVLCTDAIGKWAVGRMEAGDPPDWESYWDRSPEAWLEEILALRESRDMRFDDTTLLMLRVGAVSPTAAACYDQEALPEYTSDGTDDTEKVPEVEETPPGGVMPELESAPELEGFSLPDASGDAGYDFV